MGIKIVFDIAVFAEWGYIFFGLCLSSRSINNIMKIVTFFT